MLHTQFQSRVTLKVTIFQATLEKGKLELFRVMPTEKLFEKYLVAAKICYAGKNE